MALQITDLVSTKALADLKKLDTELQSLKKTCEDVAGKLAMEVNITINGKEDLANLTKVITTNFERLSNATKKVKSEEEALNVTLNKQAKSIKNARDENKKLREVRNAANTETKEGRKIISALNDEIDKNTKFIKQNSDAYTKQKMGIGSYFKSILQSAASIAGITSAVNAFKGAILSMYKQIRNFEQSNSTLQAILGVTSNQMKDLQVQAMNLGRATKYTASEVTELQTELARLGFAKEEILAMTDSVLKFGLATGGSMADSAALAGAMIRTFGANANETKEYVAAMTLATNKSALSFGKLQVGLPLVAGAAKALGWEIEDVLALYGKLADSGMSASIAATALRNILLELGNENSKLSKQMGGNIKTFDDFVGGLQKMSDENVTLAMSNDEVGKRSAVALQNLMRHADGIKVLRGQITDCTKEFEHIADVMQDNVATAEKRVQSAWQDVALAFSTSKGKIKDVLDWAAKALTTVANKIRTINELMGQKDLDNKTEISDNFYKKGGLRDEIDAEIRQREQKYIKSGLNQADAYKKAIEDTKQTYIGAMNDMDNTAKSKQNFINMISGWYDENGKSIYKSNDLFGAVSSPDVRFTKLVQEGRIPESALWDMENYILELQKTASTAKNTKIVLEEYFNTLANPKQEIGDYTGDPIEDNTKKGNNDAERKRKEAERLAQERANQLIKLQELISDANVKTQAEGLQKELDALDAAYLKKKDTILKMDMLTDEEKERGYKALDAALDMEKKKIEKKYDTKMITENAKNALEAEIKGSQEAKDAELVLLQVQYDQELELAKQYQLDLTTLDEKYAQKRREIDEKYAMYEIENQTKTLKAKTDALKSSLNEKQTELNISYTNGKISEEEYARQSKELAYNTAKSQLGATIESLRAQLEVEALTTDKRAELYQKLTDAKLALSELEIDNSREGLKKAIALLDKWGNAALDTFSAIAGYMSQMYSNEIDDIDEEKDALDEKYDKDIERIERLEDQGAISSEEAEARKRAAKDQTEQKEEELNKKKQEIAYKQAVWEKATSASQTAISTALGIMKVWAAEGTTASKVIMTALVAAQGAMQLATILATPIPKYAKGTEGHKGGLAVVGDGGRSEFVMVGSQGWITPATSTLVDLPKGAQVFPDAKSVMMTLPVYNENGKQVKVVNDYKELERKQKTANGLLKVIAANTRGNSNYNQYKKTIW